MEWLESIEWNPLRWTIETRTRLALLALRLYLGAAMLWVGYHQWHDPNFSLTLPSLLLGWARQNPFFFYEDILRYIATPNAHIIAWLLPWLEMTVGGLLVLGLFNRVASITMLVLSANFFLATQHTTPAAAGLNLAFIAMAIVLFFGEAGHAYGCDQLVESIRERFGWVRTQKKKRRSKRLIRPVRIKPERLKHEPQFKPKEKIMRPVLVPSANRIESALGSTIHKLKERQKLQLAQKPAPRHYQEIDDEEDEEDDIYAYHDYGDDEED